MAAVHDALPPSLLAAAIAATMLAGCGGDGRLSHADFVKRADAVCSAYRSAAEPIARPRTYAQIVAYVNKTLPLYEAARIKLAELKPAAKDATTVRDWLAADGRIAAALRDLDVDKFAKNQPKTTDPGDVSIVQRSLIQSKAGGTSGGISGPTSSGLAAGSGSLRGIYTTQVKDPNLGASGQATRAGGSGKASRSADEIALVFTKNKGAIDAMYARALRDAPALQGKVVLEITISPSGDITAARIISSELNDKEFESKLLARIRLFKFEAKDVATLTATKPIDFFPAG